MTVSSVTASERATVRRRRWQQGQAEGPDVLVLSVKLASGRFASELRMPLLNVTADEKDQLIGQWLDLIATGFRIGATEMTASFEQVPESRRDEDAALSKAGA